MGLYKRGWEIETDTVVHGGGFGRSRNFCRNDSLHHGGDPYGTDPDSDRGNDRQQCGLTGIPGSLYWQKSRLSGEYVGKKAEYIAKI